MRDADLDALRGRLERDPSPMVRVTEAQRLRHERAARSGALHLEDALWGEIADLRASDLPDRSVRRDLERDRDNLRVPADVNAGLPMDEEAIRATSDRVLRDAEWPEDDRTAPDVLEGAASLPG